MGDLIRAIDSSFQRILRWAYPGGLLLVLLHAAEVVKIDDFNESPLMWLLVVGVLVAGATIYLFQSTVVNQIVSIIVVRLRWEVNAYEVDTPPRRGFVKLAHFFDKWARATKARWPQRDDKPQPEDLHSYLNYAWSVHHAAFITGWLTFIFFIYLQLWWFIIISLLFCAGALVQFAHLSRIRFSS